ncbi:CbtB-domain containing protein [Billgrantia azerbaijanica]|nr:CbtB-domain containing protein [Halomonas azerbaijanica]
MSASTSSFDESSLHSSAKQTSLLQNGAVLLFGIAILFAVGFMSMDVAHNAAHDTRHSFVFPCH